MPLDPLKYSDPIVRVYEACVDELLVNLAKHFSLASIGKTGSWEYEVMMLSKLGEIRKETAKIIAKRVADNEPMIEEAVKTAMLDALEEVEPDLKQAATEGLLHDADMEVVDGIQERLKAYSRQARNHLNLVNTVMLSGTAEAYRKGVYAAVDVVKQMDSAQDILNVQTGKVITGVATPQQAVRAAVKAMADNGITGFYDRTGRKWSAEAYVRMDIKTTVSNAANQAVMDRNASYGNDIVWPRVNATARPGCYPWQGKLISMSDNERDVPDGNGKMRHVYPVSKTTYGEPAGIWGINCHHGPMNVFIPGFSYVRGEENEPSKAENDRLYQLTQEQRRLERQVRYAKRDAAMYDAAGDRQAFEQAALKVKDAQAKLKTFVNNHDTLVLDGDKTSVFGYNRSVSSKVAWASRAEKARTDKRDSYSGSKWPKTGVQISAAQHRSLTAYANERGITLEGFTVFDGDISAVKKQIDSLEKVIKDFPGILSGSRSGVHLAVSYDMPDSDYAETVGSLIKINGFAFRDAKRLRDEYQSDVDRGWFAKGTTSESILIHEAGHMVARKHRIPVKRIAKAACKTSNELIATQVLAVNLSEYASYNRLRESIAEAFSAYYSGSDNEMANLIVEMVNDYIAKR